MNLFLISLYQLVLPGGTTLDYPDQFGAKFDSLASVFTEAFGYIFPAAGLILFFVFIVSGFSMLTSGGNEEKLAQANKQLTNAVVGFIVVFASYWLIRLVEFILGVKIF